MAEEISVTSNPEQAEVYVKNTNTKERVKIGKTPIKMSMNDMVNNFARANVFMIEIEKEGFDPYRILMTRTGSNDIELLVNLEISKNMKLIKDLDYLMSQLFEVQRQIRSKDYANAVKRLDELEKDFPHYSIIYELKGSAFYLDKQFKQALNYYRKAFSVNPENRDAYIMKVYLEEKFELKPAAGTNG
jgi:tetratricopeptide (TPR) repeat protein